MNSYMFECADGTVRAEGSDVDVLSLSRAILLYAMLKGVMQSSQHM